jgi:hypothetical protein
MTGDARLLLLILVILTIVSLITLLARRHFPEAHGGNPCYCRRIQIATATTPIKNAAPTPTAIIDAAWSGMIPDIC